MGGKEVFTGEIIKEAIDIACNHGLLESMSNASDAAVSTAKILRSNPKLAAETAIAFHAESSQFKPNQSDLDTYFANHVIGTAKLAALMKMDGELLAEEQKTGLEEKLTAYISENRSLQTHISAAVKRLKKIDAINKSPITNLLTIGLREAIILILASSATAGATIAVGISASLIRTGIKLETRRLKSKLDTNNQKALTAQNNQLLYQRALSVVMLHAFLDEIKKKKSTLAIGVFETTQSAIRTAIKIAENSADIDAITDAWEHAARLTNVIIGKNKLDTREFCNEQQRIHADKADQKKYEAHKLKRLMSRNTLETAH